MRTTLVSFIGTGIRAQPGEASSYASATYEFSPATTGVTQRHTSSFFGAALLKHYRDDLSVDITRWLVLGTSASLWSELHWILPDEKQKDESNYDRCSALECKVIDRQVNQEDIREWQQHLNSNCEQGNLSLQLIDETLTRESQIRLCQILFEHILPQADVVFDISHAFRHMPVIASYVVSLMRRTHGIGKVSFWSGVWEARDRKTDITPVVQLPVCHELLEATEAIAVMDDTGNYVPLAQRLGLDLSDVWFRENTNQLTTAGMLITNMMGRLDNQGLRIDAIRNTLANQLKKELRATAGGDLAGRYANRARRALANRDWIHAIILIFEALLVRASILLKLPGDPEKYETREKARTQLKELFKGTKQASRVELLEIVRNACVHASPPPKWRRAMEVVRSPVQFEDLIRDAFKLFEDLPCLLDAQ